MNKEVKQPLKLQVKQYEECLKQAMLQSDVAALDELFAPDLSFTNHLGQLMTKQNDLQAHKSGMLKINQITLSDQKIKVYGDVAVVTVLAHIIGSFAGAASEDNFRFTRVWAKSTSNAWQVIAGHSSTVV